MPITYTTKSKAQFFDTAPSAWSLTGENVTIPTTLDKTEWVISNLQQTGTTLPIRLLREKNKANSIDHMFLIFRTLSSKLRFLQLEFIDTATEGRSAKNTPLE